MLRLPKKPYGWHVSTISSIYLRGYQFYKYDSHNMLGYNSHVPCIDAWYHFIGEFTEDGLSLLPKISSTLNHVDALIESL